MLYVVKLTDTAYAIGLGVLGTAHLTATENLWCVGKDIRH